MSLLYVGHSKPRSLDPACLNKTETGEHCLFWNIKALTEIPYVLGAS